MAISKTTGIIVGIVVIVLVVLVAIGAAQDSNESSVDRVTYHGNGGTFDGKESYIVDNSVVQSSMFTYDGHTFESWNTKADGTGIEYHYGDSVSRGTHLYAIWAIAPVIVTSYACSGTGIDFELNGEELSSLTSFYSPGKIVACSGSDWTYNTEYGVFVGKINGEERIIKISLTNCDNISMEIIDGKPTISFTASGSIGVKIIITAKGITYIGNGGTTSEGEPLVTTKDLIVSDTVPFTYAGHTFKSWNTESDGSGTTYTAGQTVPYFIALWAIWEKSSSE